MKRSSNKISWCQFNISYICGLNINNSYNNTVITEQNNTTSLKLCKPFYGQKPLYSEKNQQHLITISRTNKEWWKHLRHSWQLVQRLLSRYTCWQIYLQQKETMSFCAETRAVKRYGTRLQKQLLVIRLYSTLEVTCTCNKTIIHNEQI